MAVHAVARTCRVEGCERFVTLTGKAGRPPVFCDEHRSKRLAAPRPRRERTPRPEPEERESWQDRWARRHAEREAARAAAVERRERERRRLLMLQVAGTLRAAAAAAAARRRAAHVPQPIDHTVCGCGRDYMTVPIEEAHRCPRPRRGVSVGPG